MNTFERGLSCPVGKSQMMDLYGIIPNMYTILSSKRPSIDYLLYTSAGWWGAEAQSSLWARSGVHSGQILVSRFIIYHRTD